MIMSKKIQGVAVKGNDLPLDAVFIEARRAKQRNFISLKSCGIKLLLDDKVSGSEIKLLLALLELYQPPQDDQCIQFPSCNVLADRLGVTVQFVYRNIKNLSDRGIISKDSNDLGGAKLIRFANWLTY